MHRLGTARVSIRNGFVISAVDTEKGGRWTSIDFRRAAYPRRLTHLVMMGVAVIPVTATAASAKAAPPVHQRIQLAATVPDHPEDFRQIPADLPPPPAVAAPAPVPVAAKRPAARPAATHVVVPASRAQIAQIIRDAAARHGVDPDWLLRVAMCESGLNPNAVNPSGATGLFQFKPATFYAHGGHNIWDPADQSEIAAKMFAQGLASAWTCR